MGPVPYNPSTKPAPFIFYIVLSDFNLKTSIYREGVPVPSFITVNPDRSYNLQLNHPPFPWLIKQAAGIQRGAMKAWDGEVAGKITRYSSVQCEAVVGCPRLRGI